VVWSKYVPPVQHLGAPVVLEVVVLKLGTHEERVAHLRGALELALQHVARIGLVRRTVRVHDVAEHRGHGLPALPPWKNLERLGVGVGDHVRLLDARESLDRATVEAHALGHGHLEFRDVHRERLQKAEHVREPEVDELDLLILDLLDHIVP